MIKNGWEKHQQMYERPGADPGFHPGIHLQIKTQDGFLLQSIDVCSAVLKLNLKKKERQINRRDHHQTTWTADNIMDVYLRSKFSAQTISPVI